MKTKILLNKIFNYLEIKFADLQGKGGTGTTVDREFTAALSLFSKKDSKLCIDIEGHEMDALLGFGTAINHIDLIQFEFGGCNIDTRIFFRDFWYFFKKNEFDLFRISPLGIIPIINYKESDECFAETNFLAQKKILIF